MRIRKPPTETEAVAWLKTGGVELLPMRFRVRRVQPRFAGSDPWDFEVEGEWADRKARFVVEYKSLFTPKAFKDAVRQCVLGKRPPDRLPLVLTPYLRPGQLDELEQLGISGIDLCGNGVVVVPDAIRIYRSGQSNRFTLTSPIKNIYRKNTSMAARVLAAAPTFPTVSTMAEEINARNAFVRKGLRKPMGLGTVSKALKTLEEDLIIDRTEGIRVLQAERLLTQLAENYEPPQLTRRRRVKVQTTASKLWILLGDRLQEGSTPVAATGLTSVGRYAVMAREEIISLYCSNIDWTQEQIRGTETDRFPNVELVETGGEPYYFDIREEKGFPWASPLQTYLELSKGDKRDQETAEQVKTILLRIMK
jgi:hypothetical protein